jgi:phosphonate transport system substrate-binding protein
MPRVLMTLLAAALVAGCGGGRSGADTPTLLIGGIPDQDVAVLEERFTGIAGYLSDALGIPVAYQPSVDYAAVVTAFANGDILLGWFGGLTGVQARLETPGAHAVVQRPIDTEFRSVFIAGGDVDAGSMADLAGLSFTFGSESSTSGHLMPRYFLTQAGVDPESDFTTVGYSGSHDTTWKLVESGSFQAGALNASVFQRAVEQGQVDTDRVRVVEHTPPYFDYHWVAHPAIDERYGAGTTQRLVDALVAMPDAGPEARELLRLFEDQRFIPTSDDNYAAIEQVARALGLIRG